MKKTLAIIITTTLITTLAFGEEKTEIHETDNEKITYATNISMAIAFPLEAVISVTESFKIPVMQFDNPVTKNNNITFKLGAALSPITMEGSFNIAWTPIAFLELYTGASIGSGWSIKDKYGLALNTDAGKKAVAEPLNFTRAFYSVNFGGALQFDLGAVVPHKWAHLMFRIDQYGLYKGITHTDKYTSWIWQSDAGENRNGLRYKASYVLGYQMPTYLNFIGMQVETEKTFFAVQNNLDKSTWGEDRFKVTFGPLLNFEITKQMTLLLMAQWQTRHPYLSASDEIYYQKHLIDTSEPETIIFKRVALVFNYTITY